jgi:predicted anti-sigma-YlaC factor YlaD
MDLARICSTGIAWCTRAARRAALPAALVLMLAAGGCANLAVNSMADALASSGSGFGSDDDPELIAAAAPFSLKLMESILAETPNHRGLLLAATQGFVQYSYAFVETRADELEDRDLQGAHAQRERARRMYLRARDYGLRGLEAAYPGFAKSLRADPRGAAARATAEDVPLLYWTGVAWVAAISLSKDSPVMIGELPIGEALVRRALELNEAYDYGAIHVFLISYEMGRAGLSADAPARARKHFARAVELSGGLQAAPFVSYAEAISVSERNRKEFEQMLRRALALDAGKKPEWQLANIVMQRRARWLLTQTDRLFVD